jgi:molybdopterin-guanine dinucleotide biosynthesis protein MobB
MGPKHNGDAAGQPQRQKHHELRRIGKHHAFSVNEIAFVGYSGTGKTTLVTSLIECLGEGRRIAYIKHNSHEFSMDREGKDTWRAARSGAASVFIGGDDGKFALLGSSRLDEWNAFYLWNDFDLVFVEGFRHGEIAKLVVVDNDAGILDEISGGEIVGTIAFVLRDDAPSSVTERVRKAAGDIPIFSAAHIEPVAAFLLDYLERRARSVPLNGLVLGGGKSTRMERDKAAIEYHGVPQVRYAHGLLSGFCDRVFVSNREDQASDPVFDGLDQIHDRFLDFGPMGGMLTAFHTHPEAAWLVLGCDLPFVDETTLRELITRRDPLKTATCYVSAHDGLPEPLCALYEPAYRLRLHQFLADGRDCPRKALINSRAQRLTLHDPRALDNINYPGEYESAAAAIGKETADGR